MLIICSLFNRSSIYRETANALRAEQQKEREERESKRKKKINGDSGGGDDRVDEEDDDDDEGLGMTVLLYYWAAC